MSASTWDEARRVPVVRSSILTCSGKYTVSDGYISISKCMAYIRIYGTVVDGDTTILAVGFSASGTVTPDPTFTYDVKYKRAIGRLYLPDTLFSAYCSLIRTSGVEMIIGSAGVANGLEFDRPAAHSNDTNFFDEVKVLPEE